MNSVLQNDLHELDRILDLAKQRGYNFLNAINDRPTSVLHAVATDKELAATGLGAVKALQHFTEKFEPLMVASTGPRYWGFVTGGATPASLAGDMLASFYDQNPQSTTGQGDVSAVIELETIRLLLSLLGLPPDFLGGFVTGATMSNFTCLGVARQWLGRQHNLDIAKDGLRQSFPIFAAVPHSSVVKCLSMLGIGSKNITLIKSLPGNREALDVAELENQLASRNGEPFILLASAGTVNTVDYDDFRALKRLKSTYKFWLHIDAAFGAFAACSPEYRAVLDGWDAADSIAIDCHKWLNVPYESAFFLVKEEHRVLQTETFQNSNAPYLTDPLTNFSYLNFLPENSRRLRALPAWFTLQAYGKDGYRELVENSVRHAKTLGEYIEQHPALELLAPVRLNNVVFTLHGHENQDRVSEFLYALNATGTVFMTPTVYQGKKGIRASFVNWRTSSEDVQRVTKEIEQVLTAIR